MQDCMRDLFGQHIVDKISLAHKEAGIFSPGHNGYAANSGRLVKPNSATAQRFSASDYWLRNQFYDKLGNVDDKLEIAFGIWTNLTSGLSKEIKAMQGWAMAAADFVASLQRYLILTVAGQMSRIKREHEKTLSKSERK
jgi:hypothetical protein